MGQCSLIISSQTGQVVPVTAFLESAGPSTPEAIGKLVLQILTTLTPAVNCGR